MCASGVSYYNSRSCFKNRVKFFFQVSPWNGAFRSYINNIKNSEKSFEELMKDEAYFRDKFTQFLFSPRGAIFQV